MPFMTWDDRFLTGVPAVDDDHRHIVELINALHDAVGGGKRAVGIEVLADLVKYFPKHFDREEQLMQAADYPSTHEHMAEHQRFAATIIRAHNDYLDGRVVDAGELLAFMKVWMVDHVLGTDLAYVPYMKAHGRA
jgi:hemerythrin